LLFFKLLPKNFISRIVGYLCLIPFPTFIINKFINWFCKKYKVNQDEFIKPDSGFKNIDSFFTRQLKPGVHKIDSDQNSIVSPVDARLDQFGEIKEDQIMQAKGLSFSLQDFIPSNQNKKFINGNFITLYLSPGDYHRIHSPVDAKILGFSYIPGTLFPVQNFIVKALKGVFAKNERIISYLQTEKGQIALCKIGALNVGKISLSYSKILANKTFRQKKEVLFPADKNISIKKGEEISTFHLGSTVIILFENGLVNFTNLKIGTKFRVGDKIASFK